MSTEKIEGMSKVTIELDLAAFAAHVWRTSDGEYQDDQAEVSPAQLIIERVAYMIHKDVQKDIRATVLSQIKDQIEEQVGEIVKATLDGEFSIVNTWGETTGRKTSLREQVNKQATEWMAKKADPYGRYSNAESNLNKIVKTVVDQQLTKEFNTVIAEEKAKILEQLRAAAAMLLAREAAKH